MENGIHKDLSIDDYHQNPTHISASKLKKAKKATNFILVESDDDDSKRQMYDFGNAFETALIEPEKFNEEVCIIDLKKRPVPDKNFQTAANRDWKKAQIELAGDKYILMQNDKKESNEDLQAMVKSCNDKPFIKSLVSTSEKQVSIFWKDLESGLSLKTRPDLIKETPNGVVIVDVKTCKDASPNGFAKDAATLNYPIQATMQIQGVEEMIGPVSHYFYLAVEKTAPYNAQLYRLTDEDREFFDGQTRELYSKVAKAKESGIYPGYEEQADNAQGIIDLPIPLWAKL